MLRLGLRLVSIWSQTIADRRSQITESSAIGCVHMETHFCDRLRSCDRDRRRSQKIEPCSIICDRLRSSAIVCDPAIKKKRKIGAYFRCLVHVTLYCQSKNKQQTLNGHKIWFFIYCGKNGKLNWPNRARTVCVLQCVGKAVGRYS